VHVKDQVDTAGIRTTFGSAIFADNVPARDDILITKLRAAGTILVGKTRLPEFGNKGLTDGPSFGTTRNPWDRSRTCGGSSGGAAAATAAGAGPLALGTDGAGSIRIPAACCGVVGLKPTLGTVAWEAAIDAFANYTYAGPSPAASLTPPCCSACLPAQARATRGASAGRRPMPSPQASSAKTCRVCASALF
jgi:Asp-tRNA(Asn)/Glu-tRNA(Gln) amidotransferase A subunit family amidase